MEHGDAQAHFIRTRLSSSKVADPLSHSSCIKELCNLPAQFEVYRWSAVLQTLPGFQIKWVMSSIIITERAYISFSNEGYLRNAIAGKSMGLTTHNNASCDMLLSTIDISLEINKYDIN